MQSRNVAIRRSPVAYSALLSAMEQRTRLLGFAQVYHELCNGALKLTNDGIRTAVFQVVKALDNQEYLPVYTEYAEEYAEFAELAEVSPENLYLPPLTDFLTFDGINLWNSSFDDWDDLWQLVLAICSQENSWEMERISSWWVALSNQLGLAELPPLDEIDRSVTLERAYQDTIPGLRAICEWLAGETGNVFVDVAPEDSGELRWEYDWSMETINSLSIEYDEAEAAIFGPANALFNRYKNNRDAVLRQVAIYLLTGELIDEHS